MYRYDRKQISQRNSGANICWLREVGGRLHERTSKKLEVGRYSSTSTPRARWFYEEFFARAPTMRFFRIFSLIRGEILQHTPSSFALIWSMRRNWWSLRRICAVVGEPSTGGAIKMHFVNPIPCVIWRLERLVTKASNGARILMFTTPVSWQKSQWKCPDKFVVSLGWSHELTFLAYSRDQFRSLAYKRSYTKMAGTH